MSDKNIEHSFRELEKHLEVAGEAHISTIRNYHFAVLVYPPNKELQMRDRLQRSTRTLQKKGWNIKTISLLEVVMRRLKNRGEGAIERTINKEKRFSRRDPERGLNELKRAIQNELEGDSGIAKDIAELIDQYISEDPNRADRTLVFIGRVGALYPFFRTSALLRHLHTEMKTQTPTILLYPGRKHGDAGLSFMERLNPDRDYRPRIY